MYEIRKVEKLNLECYTQSYKSKLNNIMFELDNLYFKKELSQKVKSIENIFKDWNYIIFDTETTGRNLLWNDLPYQIAAKKYKNHQEVGSFEIIMNIPIYDEYVLELSWIKIEDIKKWVSLEEWFKKFLNFIWSEEIILIAHNAEFDVAMLNNCLVKLNITLNKPITSFCSMQMYYTLYKHILWESIFGSSLDLLSNTEILNIKIDENKRHQADYDCDITKILLDKIYFDFKDRREEINNILKKDNEDKIWTKNNIFDKNQQQALQNIKTICTKFKNDYIAYQNLFSDINQLSYAIYNYVVDEYDNPKSELKIEKVNNYDFKILNIWEYWFFIKKSVPFDKAKDDCLESYISKKPKFDFYYNDPILGLEQKVDLAFNENLIESSTRIISDIKIYNKDELVEAIIELKDLNDNLTKFKISLKKMIDVVLAYVNKQEEKYFSDYYDFDNIKLRKIFQKGYTKFLINEKNINDMLVKNPSLTLKDLLETSVNEDFLDTWNVSIYKLWNPEESLIL